MPENSLRRDRPSTLNLEAKISVLTSMGKFESAEKLIRSALSESKSARLYTLLGYCLQSQGRLSEAKTTFRTALDIDPHHVEAAMILAALLCDTSQYDEAQRVFASIEKEIDKAWQAPKHTLRLLAERHLDLAKHYAELCLWGSAATQAQYAVEISPDLVSARLDLANYLIKDDRADAARQILEPLASGDSVPARARILLGIAWIRLGQPLMAREQWKLLSTTSRSDHLEAAFQLLASEF